MSRKVPEKISNHAFENPEGLWTDFGTLISKLMKISRLNSKMAQLT